MEFDCDLVSKYCRIYLKKNYECFFIYSNTFLHDLKTVVRKKVRTIQKVNLFFNIFPVTELFCFSLIYVRGMFIVDWIQGEIQRWSLFNSFLVWVVRYVTKQTTGKCLHFGPFWQIGTPTIICKIREINSFWQMKMIRGLPPITFQF